MGNIITKRKDKIGELIKVLKILLRKIVHYSNTLLLFKKLNKY